MTSQAQDTPLRATRFGGAAAALPAAATRDPFSPWSKPGQRPQGGEGHARRALRGQVARLERELAEAQVSSFPHRDVPPGAAVGTLGPRLLSLGELERVRDELAHRVARARRAMANRADAQERSRVQLEHMLLAPGQHRFVRIANADLGVGGCGVWQVRPRLGLIGMLAGWWQVKLSSGCPLPQGSRRCATP